MNFCNRLKDYRESLQLNANEFSQKLGLSKSYYSLIETGKREPSKTFLYKLIEISEKPEEWWIFGIEKREEIIEIREDFKALKTSLQCWEMIKEKKLEDIDFKNLFNDINLDKLNEMEQLFIKALKTDLKHYYYKKNNI